MPRISIAKLSIVPSQHIQAIPIQEEVAHRIAWAAIKHGYMKVGDSWIRKIADGFEPRGI